MDSNSQSPKKNATVKRRLRLVSLVPVEIGDWVIQTSILNNQNISMVLYNVATLRCIVRYFTDEVEAHEFLHDVISGDRDVPEDDY